MASVAAGRAERLGAEALHPYPEDVLEYCTPENLGFIPWFPLAAGNLADPGSPLAPWAEQLGAQPAQIALAWLLRKSPVMLVIPGTSQVKHLEENTAAALLELDDAMMEELESAAAQPQRDRR